MTPHRPAEAAPHRTDFSNPAEVAVEVTEVRGQLALLSQQVSAGLSNVSSQLAAMQGDLRDVQKDLKGVSQAQHALGEHSTGLERLALAIENQTKENVAWRRTHEAENRVVADRVTLWRGVVIGCVALGGMLTTAGIYFVQDGFNRSASERARIEASHAADINRLERVIERNQADIRELQQTRKVQ